MWGQVLQELCGFYEARTAVRENRADCEVPKAICPVSPEERSENVAHDDVVRRKRDLHDFRDLNCHEKKFPIQAEPQNNCYFGIMITTYL